MRGQDGRVYDWMKRETKLCVVCIPSGYIALLSTHALPPEPPPINKRLVYDRICDARYRRPSGPFQRTADIIERGEIVSTRLVIETSSSGTQQRRLAIRYR